jgi:hypothetical protein
MEFFANRGVFDEAEIELPEARPFDDSHARVAEA